MTYEKAKSRARANADYFGIPYYVASTTLGFEVTRDKPNQENRILFIAQPSIKIHLADCLKSLYK